MSKKIRLPTASQKAEMRETSQRQVKPGEFMRAAVVYAALAKMFLCYG